MTTTKDFVNFGTVELRKASKVNYFIRYEVRRMTPRWCHKYELSNDIVSKFFGNPMVFVTILLVGKKNGLINVIQLIC